MTSAGAERGGLLAEAALVLPLLLLVIFGIMYVGLLLYTHSVVQTAAAQGARVYAAALAEDPKRERRPQPEELAAGYVQAVLAPALRTGTLQSTTARIVTAIAGEECGAAEVVVIYQFQMAVPLMERWGATENGIRVEHRAVYRIDQVVQDNFDC